jgi:Threonine dehydrogenase and related Zn-dependent dehydrogenases
VLELTGGKGADLVIEASGHDASLAAVLDYVRTGGRVTFVGISIGRKVPVELGKIQSKSLTIKGTIGSPACGRRRCGSWRGRSSTCRRSRPTSST